MKPPKSKVRKQWLVAIAIAGVVLYFAWLFLWPNELQRAASRMAHAMRDGDANGLFAATISEERVCSNLNPQRLRGAWELLIEPHLKSSKFVRIEPAEQTSNDYQATTSMWFEDRYGKPWRLTMIANRTGGEPKTSVLIHMLGIAANFDESGHSGVPMTSQSLLAVVKKHRFQLEAMGIRQVSLNPNTCLSWDQLENKLARANSEP